MYKKWLSLAAGGLLVLTIIAGCSNKNTEVSPSDTASPPVSTGTAEPSAIPSAGTSASPGVSPSHSEDEQKMILDVFQALLKTPGNEKAAISAMRLDISKLSPENANQLVLSFEAYQKEAVAQGNLLGSALIELIQKAEEPYNEKILNDLSKITDAGLKTALQAVFDKGYKIIVPEGMYEAVINYGVYRETVKYVTPDIAAYIGIMATESDQRMSEDAAIIIPIDEVFARALAAESFITEYHDSEKFDEVEQRYMIYVDAFFFGQNNTPAFDYDTKKLDQEFLDSYQKAAASGKDSAIVKAAAEYLKTLESNKYTLTKAVTDYRDSMTKGLKNTVS